MILLAILLAAFFPTSTNDFHFVKFPEPKARSASPEYKSLYAVPNFGSDYSSVPKYVGTWECVAPGPLWWNPYYPYISQWKFAIVMEGIEERKGMFNNNKKEFNFIKNQYEEKQLYSTNNIHLNHGFFFNKMPTASAAQINVEGFDMSNALDQICIAINALGGDSTRVKANYVGLDCATNGQWVYSNFTNAISHFASTEKLNQLDYVSHFTTNKWNRKLYYDYDESRYSPTAEGYYFDEDFYVYDGDPRWEKVTYHSMTNTTEERPGDTFGTFTYEANTWANNDVESCWYTDKGHKYEDDHLHISYSPRLLSSSFDRDTRHRESGESYGYGIDYPSELACMTNDSSRIIETGAIQFFRCREYTTTYNGWFGGGYEYSTQTVWVAMYSPMTISQKANDETGLFPLVYSYPSVYSIAQAAGFSVQPSATAPEPQNESDSTYQRKRLMIHYGEYFYPIYRFSNRVK